MTQSFTENIYWEPSMRQVPCSHRFAVHRGRQILDKSSPKWLFDYSCEEWLRGEEWGVTRGRLPRSGSSARLLWEKQYLRHSQQWPAWWKEKKREWRGEGYSGERPVCAKASSRKERHTEEAEGGQSMGCYRDVGGMVAGSRWGQRFGGYPRSCPQKHHLTEKQLPLKSTCCWLDS